MVEQTDDRISADVAALAPDTTDRREMICPVCGYGNLQGDDLCANCGADLRTSDIPQATSPFERLLVEVPLRALKTRPPFTVDGAMTVAEVVRLMRDERTADVLVIDDGRLVGIFTERDAALKLIGQGDGRDHSAQKIGDVMTHDPVVLRANDSVAVAVQKMAVGGFRHIPLVDEGRRPIGVVSAADIFRHILRIVE